jgi:hypothetical protein
MAVKRTERGFAGHFICAKDCWYRRNTLLEAGNLRIVVSSVGNYHLPPGIAKKAGMKEGVAEEIGFERWYETMAFYAKWEDPYWEAEIGREVGFHADWGIFEEPKRESDLEMDEVHEGVVAELTQRLKEAAEQGLEHILEPDPCD